LWADLLIGAKSVLEERILLLLKPVAVLGHGAATYVVYWEIAPQSTPAALFLLWADFQIGVRFQLGAVTLLL
jgi:hypothetical protein